MAEQGREWIEPGEPDAVELRGMTAYYGGVDQVKERLGKLATSHWEKITSVKEGETIINFAYAVRMRSESRKSLVPWLNPHAAQGRRIGLPCLRISSSSGKILKSVPAS